MKPNLANFYKKLGRRSVIGIPFLWLLLFFLLPFIIVLKISFSEGDYIPPYHAMLQWGEDQVAIVLNYYSYYDIIKDDEWSYLPAYLSSIQLAFIATILCIIIGFWIAHALVKVKNYRLRNACLWLVATPTIIAILLHFYVAHYELSLSPQGLINNFLLKQGFITTPLEWINRYIIICLGTAFVHLSLVVFPVFFELEKRDASNYKKEPINTEQVSLPKLFINVLWCIFRPFLDISRKMLAFVIAFVFICIIGMYIIPNPLGIEHFESSSYITPYLNSLELAFFSTLFCLIIGYPMAYAIARAEKTTQAFLILLIVMPTWTALLIRIYAWMTILGNGSNGLMNQFLMHLGIISTPIEVLNTSVAVYIGVVYAYLPFMVLPLYANLVKHDLSLIEAASDLGCKRISTFWKITFPLSKNGIITGCMLVFIPIIGEFVIPELLGGSQYQLIGQTIYREYFTNNDWPRAAALAVIMLLLLIIPIQLFNRNQSKQMEANK